MQTLPVVLTMLFAPFVAFAISLIFFMRQHRVAQAIVLTGGALSVVCSVWLFTQGPADPLRFLWFQSGDVQLNFGFLLDGLSLWFGMIVAFITFCIQVYSLGYMADDPAKTRFFAMLGLFGWAMLSFVYAVDLLQAFIFWELVGLASFFLIGFWYEKPSAVAAAKKAFIMTRVGDVGLFIGILLILNKVGFFDIPQLVDAESGLHTLVDHGTLTLIMVLIFTGIMGKSAQFPLHTWLPDAMEGPTPVSALLHSATMVAAGVFLFARLHPLFMQSAETLTFVLIISTFTAVLSSTIAMVERDIKKVLAYSSISQLGFMLIALAAGGLFAGVFHLITHAIFKALLFLCAGSYIHHCGTNDMEEIGVHGGRRMKFTTFGLVIGGAALAGIPPLSGFFSKEEIFLSLSHSGQLIYLGGALFAAFLTAYYTFRMIFLVTRPRHLHEASHDGHHAADSPIVMLLPMMALALLTIFFYFAGAGIAAATGHEFHVHVSALMFAAIGIVAAGIALAWVDFGRAGAARKGFVSAIKPLHTLFTNKWYVDDFYHAVIVRATWALAAVMAKFEVKGFDDGYDKLAEGVAQAGGATARAQNGWVQFYAATLVIMVGAVSIFVGLR